MTFIASLFFKDEKLLFSRKNNREEIEKFIVFRGFSRTCSLGPAENDQLLTLQHQGLFCSSQNQTSGRDEGGCCRGAQEGEGLFQGAGQIHWAQVANCLQEDRPLQGDIQPFWQGPSSFEGDESISCNLIFVEWWDYGSQQRETRLSKYVNTILRVKREQNIYSICWLQK